MKKRLPYLILVAYLIVFLSVFWYAQFFLQCTGFFCNVIPTLLIWSIFILCSFFIFYFRPLSIKKTIIRFFMSVISPLVLYVIYYQALDYSYWNDHKWFLDYSLPGMMLTIACSISWLLPLKNTAPKS